MLPRNRSAPLRLEVLEDRLMLDHKGFPHEGPGGGGGGTTNYTIVDLGTLAGGDDHSSLAQDLNDKAQVVGDATIGTAGFQPFVVVPQDTDGDGANDLMIELGTLLGGTGSGATGINLSPSSFQRG